MISGEKILITGASSGIGKALAKQLAAQDNQVIACARSLDILNQLATQQKNIIPFELDVANMNDLQMIRQQLLKFVNKLDRVIICAGVCEYLDLDDSEWLKLYQRIYSVNVFGAINTIELVLPLLRQSLRQYPHIIAISSMSTEYPFTRAQAYGSSKAALEYSMNAFRVDLAVENIKVTTIHPGFIETPMIKQNNFAMPFKLTAEQAARRICEALRNKPRRYAFPKRLYFSLQLLRFLAWFGIKPKVVKVRT